MCFLVVMSVKLVCAYLLHRADCYFVNIAKIFPSTNIATKVQISSVDPFLVAKYNPNEGITISKKAVRWA
jgi:hypothetical protein